MSEEKKDDLELSAPPILKKKTKLEVFNDHARAIGSYLWQQILLPAIKATVSDAGKAAVDMAVFGETRNDNRRLDDRRDYNRISTTYYSSDSRRDRLNDYRDDRKYNTSRELDELIWSNRADAEKTLDYLQRQINDYGQAYLADLYKKLKVEVDFPDYDAGWETLRGARVVPVRNGYRLILPDPVRLR